MIYRQGELITHDHIADECRASIGLPLPWLSGLAGALAISRTCCGRGTSGVKGPVWARVPSSELSTQKLALGRLGETVQGPAGRGGHSAPRPEGGAKPWADAQTTNRKSAKDLHSSSSESLHKTPFLQMWHAKPNRMKMRVCCGVGTEARDLGQGDLQARRGTDINPRQARPWSNWETVRNSVWIVQFARFLNLTSCWVRLPPSSLPRQTLYWGFWATHIWAKIFHIPKEGAHSLLWLFLQAEQSKTEQQYRNPRC